MQTGTGESWRVKVGVFRRKRILTGLIAVWVSATSDAFAQGHSEAQEPDYWNEPERPDPVALVEPDTLPRLRGKELLYQVPDLKVRPWPPSPTIGVGLVSHFPFQFLGLGASLTAYAAPWLRFYAHYSAGVALTPRSGGGGGFSNYAEALIGVRLLGLHSERAVDLVPDDGQPWYRRRGPRPKPTLKAWLPSDHAIFLEAGALTGPIFFEACEQNCEADLETPELLSKQEQLVFPVAGIRYVYFVNATSKRKKEIDRRMLIQLYAHAIIKPFHDPGYQLWMDGTAVERHTLGGRFGFDIPFCGANCASIELVAGYLPMPGSVLFEANWKKSF